MANLGIVAPQREMRTIRSGDARICAESIGNPDDPAILLLAGSASSMDWWEDELCERIAAQGRRVVRYDNRDTGQSTTYEPGAPGYTGQDLVADAVAVLDGFSIDSAHLVGLSMGGGIAQELALLHRDRVETLTLMSTTLAVGDAPGLPGMTPEAEAAMADAPPAPDWSDRDAAIDYLVEGERPFAGPGNFDEERVRRVAARVVDRSIDLEARTNHFLAEDEAPEGTDLADLAGLPALVIHGLADGMFPPAHGRALAAAIPGARLVELEDVGHQFPPESTWDALVPLLIDQTAKTTT